MQWGNSWKIKFNERKTELMNITRNKTHQFQSLNFGRTILEDILGIIFQTTVNGRVILKCQLQNVDVKSLA